ncbi:acyltransferase [Mycolicibacterium sp. P1-18]|uniref:acyltransferase family protein n=1 Tax=Mycolicibacterium sp. P1-18 TaxID=2024615 RepID=UPI0011F3573E|nr:acyltransferase [Mycolicibacterium sp. P1-18]KAA0097545.1 acyltransferase [Mycolicibacterium sp. P1-18]
MSQDVTSATPASGSPEPASTKPRRARIIGLDGVRGLLCLSIAVTHITGHYSPKTAATWQTNVFGFSLVYFFVLSGFLLSLPFVRNLIKDRTAATLPNVTDYTVHRLARIMPAYVLIFLFVNFVLQVSYVQNPTLQPLGTDDGTAMITDPGMLVANLTLTQSYFPAYVQTGINPSWSLTLEYAFYASLPLLFMVVFALRKRLSVNPLVLATAVPAFLLVLGLVGRALIPVVFAHAGTTDFMLLNWGPNWAAVFTKSFLTNADNFAFGMLAAIMFVAMERGELPERLSRRVRTISTVAILPVLLACGVLLVFASQFVTAGVGVVAALMILIVVAPLARHQKSRLATALDFRPIRFVGEISLSAYLWHFPVLLMLGRIGWMAGDTLPGMLWNIVLALAVTILAGAVTYYLIEKPAMNYAKRIRSKKKPALA